MPPTPSPRVHVPRKKRYIGRHRIRREAVLAGSGGTFNPAGNPGAERRNGRGLYRNGADVPRRPRSRRSRRERRGGGAGAPDGRRVGHPPAPRSPRCLPSGRRGRGPASTRQRLRRRAGGGGHCLHRLPPPSFPRGAPAPPHLAVATTRAATKNQTTITLSPLPPLTPLQN